ncbi:DsbC family protein [Dickeya sp. NCPPB 3274]|uniref:DsbC family protein n=1 Tax=Dickeya sp. NCPPB 3274 TaxID=568766 RepID=UPI0005B3798E|nr:DsbC family protein [Dickeya sp. NCPPB 3274]
MQTNLLKSLALAAAVFVQSGFVHAQNTSSDTAAVSTADAAVQQAQDKFKATFTNMNVSDFRPSPVPGVYEIHTNGNILYFAPPFGENPKGVIIFGEMYDANGNNLTQAAKVSALKAKWDRLDLKSAITIGNANAPEFWEVTDPDCPYCREWHKWIKEYAKQHQVKRNLIFMLNPGHPDAPPKIEHIICSKDKESAINDMYEGKDVKLVSCPEAKSVIEYHQKLVREFGANGTPSFIFKNSDGAPELIVGFSREKVIEKISLLTAAKNGSDTTESKPKEKTTKK